jgi:hypothetical protein
MFADQRLVIGCPLRGREWMIQPWFEAAVKAAAKTDINFCFAFVIDEGDSILPIVKEYCAHHELPAYYVEFPPYVGPQQGVEHHWNPEKVKYMVDLRNQLLSVVRNINPDYFLSLDSDILLKENVIEDLLLACEQYDAVGGKVYLARQARLPSYGNLIRENKNMHRPDVSHLVPVDIIMAVKMMTRQAYNVDYRYEPRGEDLGWSAAAKEACLKLGFDGRTVSKHIMDQSNLYSVDPRVGF